MRLVLLLYLLLAACAPSGDLPQEDPQLVLFNGVIYTQVEERVVEAIVLQEGRVLAVGTTEEMMALATDDTLFLDLKGKAVYPGFADAHAHLVGIGEAAVTLDLVGTESYEEVIERVKVRHAELPQGEWLLGRGWDQNDWPASSWGSYEFPTHMALSEAVPDRPVVLIRVDGHALLANAAAMEAAGVGPGTPTPEGGAILGLTSGELSGVFIDNAESLITAAIPESSEESVRDAVLAARDLLHRQGITQFHDAGVGRRTLGILEDLAGEQALQLRMHTMLHGSDDALLERYFAKGPEADVGGHGTLAIRAIKVYADGALGSRGAALLEPYHDADYHAGLVVTPLAKMKEISRRALETGFQVCTHAIGDRGIRQTLQAYAWAKTATEMEKEDVRSHVARAPLSLC